MQVSEVRRRLVIDEPQFALVRIGPSQLAIVTEDAPVQRVTVKWESAAQSSEP